MNDATPRPRSRAARWLLPAALSLLLLGCAASGSERRLSCDDGEGAAALVPPPGFADPLTPLSRMPGSTFVEILEVRARDDGLVFFCSGVQGLMVADATDPDHVRPLSRLVPQLGSGRYPRCQHLALDGEVIYLASRGDEVQPTPFVSAFDLSTSPPRELGAYTEAGRSFEGLAAAGGLVYAAMHEDGLAVLAREGGTFRLRGRAAGLVNAWGVAVRDGLAFVADGVGGLAVVDATRPEAPRVIGRVATGGAAQSVELLPDGRTAVVAAGSAGLVTVDVSTPTAPRVLAAVPTPGTAVQVALAWSRAYVADWGSVLVFDLTDPAAPRLVAREQVKTRADFSRVLGVGARGDVVFAGEWTGLHALRFHPERVAPDIDVASETLSFGPVPAGGAAAVALVVQNRGTAPLTVTDVRTEPGFAVDERRFDLAPGERRALEVTYRPQSDAPSAADLVLCSNDPDAEALDVLLLANQKDAAVGAAAPEVTVELTDGRRWQLSDARGDVVLLAYFATF